MRSWLARLAGLSMASLLAASCASPGASVSESAATVASPTPGASATLPASAPPSPTPVATPPPNASASPAFAETPPLIPGPWRAVTVSTTGTISDVVAMPGGGLLAVGADGWNGAIWTSRDAETWMAVTSVPAIGADDAKGLSRVLALAGGGYLALGGWGARYSEGYGSVVWASADGTAWRQLAAVSGAFQLDVAEGGPGIMAIGSHSGLDYLNGAMAWTSNDEVTWTESTAVTAPPESAMLDLVRFGDGWIAVGLAGHDPSQGLAWSSADGLAWDLLPTAPALAGAGISRAVVVDGQLLAGGSIQVDYANGNLRRPAAWTSADGSSWSLAFAQGCCGEFVDLYARDDGVLGVYRWFRPDVGDTQLVLVRWHPDGTWQVIGRPQVDPDITMQRLAVADDRLVGIGQREVGTDSYQGVILLPPAPL